LFLKLKTTSTYILLDEIEAEVAIVCLLTVNVIVQSSAFLPVKRRAWRLPSDSTVKGASLSPVKAVVVVEGVTSVRLKS
jgi:hypothetical protein